MSFTRSSWIDAPIESMNRAAVLAALASAALFGVSTPAAKALLGVVHPVILAGLFYCGAGIGIALLRALAALGLDAPAARQQPLARQDYGWLAGAIALGGIAGPVLLMLGLARTPAATASLLLTIEGAATALLAWFVFHENFDRRIALGMACLVAGAATVSWSGTPTIESFAGPLAIIGACVAWGIDNNLTRKVSLADPLQIAQWKGLIAGPVNLLVAAGTLMAVGVWLHLTERHAHAHTHRRMVHAHAHSHDEHHRHTHGPQDPPGEPHTHAHEHDALTHSHPHVPDMHHDHRH